MAICIRGHYGTRDPKDKSAKRAKEVQGNWKEYRKDLAHGRTHNRKDQKKAIKELYGEGVAPSPGERRK